jgi:hypothetical protein
MSTRTLRLTKALALLTVLGLGWQADAWSAAYYVDAVAGSDANPGTSQSTPWKSVPGMSGATSWGTITSGNKLAAGSTIDIKAGSAFTGKRWLIDTTYYQSGTSTARTTIRVSSTWGSGNVLINGSGASVPAYNGGVQISSNMNYITLTGVDATRRIEIKNYSGHAGILLYQGGGPSARGQWNEFKWFDVHHNSTNGIATDWQDNLLLQDGLTHHNGAVEGAAAGSSTNGAGALLGDAADAGGNNNIVRRVTAYSNGVNARPNDGSTSIGFQQTGSVNLLYDSCEAYGNGRDGFDGGRADNAGDSSATFLNCYSHDNGEDGYGWNSGPTGNVVGIHINGISARNGQGNWTTYDGAHIELYNCVGMSSNANFLAFASYAGWPVPTIKIRNSYLRVLAGGKQISYYNQAAGYPKFDSDYNIWAPNAANSEAFDDDGTGKTYAAPPSWKGAHDKIGIANVQAFVNAATDDYHLANNTGPASKAGIYISAPSMDLTDRNGTLRSNPPDIGVYQFGGGSIALLPPTNLRVVP